MFKSLTTAALLGAAQAQEGADAQEIVEIVTGILRGALDAEGFTDVEKCMGDASTVIKDAEAAVQDFAKKDAADVAAGLKEVAAVLKAV